MAVAAPLHRERGRGVGEGIKQGKTRRKMRTRFGGIEEVLRGREGSVWRTDRRATLELVVAIQKVKGIRTRLFAKEEIK